MKESIILFIKGIIIGIGKMLPGVSGGMLAILLGVYEEGLEAIAHFFDAIKKYSKFLLIIGSGIGISIILTSKVIMNFLGHYYLPTMLLFIGLMIGGIPGVYEKTKGKKKSSFLLFVVPFLSLLLLPFLRSSSHEMITGFWGSILLIIVGIIDAGTMIIPGISGTAILMILGYYEPIIGSVSQISSLSSFFLTMPILLPFGIGLGIGILLFVKLMDFLLHRHETSCYQMILGFATSSIILLFMETLKHNYRLGEIMISFFCLIIGFLLSTFLEKFDQS